MKPDYLFDEDIIHLLSQVLMILPNLLSILSFFEWSLYNLNLYREKENEKNSTLLSWSNSDSYLSSFQVGMSTFMFLLYLMLLEFWEGWPY